MARGKKHPLEKWWKKVFDEFKFGFPFWLPWYHVELKRIPEGLQVEDLKVAAANKDEMRTVAWTIVDIINNKGGWSRVFVDALEESAGRYAPIPARWFNLMADRSFYHDKTLADVDEEDRVDEKGRQLFIETSRGLMLTSLDERDYIDEENRKVYVDEENRANEEER